MAFSFKRSFPTATTYKKPVVNKDNGETLTNGKEYDIISNSEKLAASGLQATPSMDNGVQEASNSIFHSFGISILGQSNDGTTSILSGDDLQDDDSETITATTYENPNIVNDRTTQLKPRKVSASEIFNQTTSNPINEADECQPKQYKKEEQKSVAPPEVTDMSFDLFNEAEQDLLQVYGNNL
jgi:hypothetical protein